MRRLLPLALLPLLLPVVRAEDESPTPTPDFAFYEDRIAPIVHGNCAECHADPRKRLGRHFLRPRQGRTVRERDHERNYETILGLLEPGNPAASTWLLKALGPDQGGVEHGGGRRIRFDGIEYASMVDFINGVTLDAPTTTREAPPAPPEVGEDGLVLGVDDLVLEGDVAIEADAEGTRSIVPGDAGGAARGAFRLPVDGTWLVALDVVGPGAGATWGVDRRPEREVEAAPAGRARIGASVLLDGKRPVEATRGRLALREGVVTLAGTHGAPCAFLVPEELDHTRVEARIRMPDEAAGGDDALLLFDMDDLDNGKFVGLVDGGRRLAMGLLEGGHPRVVTTVPAPAARGDVGTRDLGVVFLEGLAVGRLDGRAVAFLHLDEHLRRRPGRFGVLSHGPLEVVHLAAFDRFEVYRTAFAEASAVELVAGTHTLRVGLPAGAPRLVALILRPFPE